MKNLLIISLAISAVCYMTQADIVRLHGNTEVHGSILKRTQQRIWIDIGPEVIAIDMDQILKSFKILQRTMMIKLIQLRSLEQRQGCPI